MKPCGTLLVGTLLVAVHCVVHAAHAAERLTASSGTGLSLNPVGVNFGLPGSFAGLTRDAFHFR